MGEAVEVIAKVLIENSPLLFICFLAGLAEFLWFRHSVKIIKEMTEKMIVEIRTAYKDSYDKYVEGLNSIYSRR